MVDDTEWAPKRWQAGPIEALSFRPEFRGPVEPLKDHNASDHLALIYESHDQQVDAVIPFIEQGLARGEQCLYIAEEHKRVAVLDTLRAADIDVDAALEEEALTFIPIEETYLSNGTFDADDALTRLENAIQDAVAEYDALRITVGTTWVDREDVTVADVIEFEAQFNEKFRGENCIALCQYNREQFTEDVIHDVIRTHPHIIYDGTIIQNVYYTPPAQFLNREQSQDREPDATRMLERLRGLGDTVLDHREQIELLHELYTTINHRGRSYEVMLQELLESGCERFDYDLGVVAHIDPDTDQFEVEHASADHDYFRPGTTLPITESYCTGSIDENGITDVAGPLGGDDEDVVVLREFGPRTSLGTYVRIDGDYNRIIFFLSSTSSDRSTSEAELTFQYLLGQWMKQEREAIQERIKTDGRTTPHAGPDRISDLVLTVSHAVIEKSTRTRIEQTACERLADSAFFDAAWIAEYPVTNQPVTPDVWAGIPKNRLDAITDTGNDREFSALPLRALESGEPETARVPDEDAACDPIHDQLREREIESVVAIPIKYQETRYGVLVVYADRSATLDEDHRSVLADLGKSLGFGFAAIKRKEALVTTQIVELEIRVSDPAFCFTQLTAETDAELRLEGLTVQEDGSSLVYATATGAPADPIRSSATSLDGIEHVRLIDEHYEGDQESFFEFKLGSETVTETFAKHGAVVTTAHAADGEATLLVELPQTADVRAVVDAFQTSFPEMEVVAKRTRDRSIQTVQGFQRDLGDQLTEKQREALQSAFFAGYFDQPRRTTGGELADSLDISSSTFHQHLQTGLQKLLATAFDRNTQ